MVLLNSGLGYAGSLQIKVHTYYKGLRALHSKANKTYPECSAIHYHNYCFVCSFCLIFYSSDILQVFGKENYIPPRNSQQYFYKISPMTAIQVPNKVWMSRKVAGEKSKGGTACRLIIKGCLWFINHTKCKVAFATPSLFSDFPDDDVLQYRRRRFLSACAYCKFSKKV